MNDIVVKYMFLSHDVTLEKSLKLSQLPSPHLQNAMNSSVQLTRLLEHHSLFLSFFCSLVMSSCQRSCYFHSDKSQISERVVCRGTQALSLKTTPEGKQGSQTQAERRTALWCRRNKSLGWSRRNGGSEFIEIEEGHATMWPCPKQALDEDYPRHELGLGGSPDLD